MPQTVDAVEPGAAALEALAARAAHDFQLLNFPAPDWVAPMQGPDGKTAIDVLVIGGGMCGQTVGLALARDGVRKVRIIDRAAYGREGPWGTFARMDTLRSPKHLTGPDLGFPALTFRAWYEAQHGRAGWDRLYKIATADWLAYLLWVRGTAGISIENNAEAHLIAPEGELVRVHIGSPRGEETVFARKVVLAGGRDGSGGAHVPEFPSLQADNSDRIFHASAAIDFARFKGCTIAVLGASASAFDNAAVALETGAKEVHLFARRPHLPQINKSKGVAYPGFFQGFRDLSDELRWRIYTYIFDVQTPPPHETVLRCDRHAGFKFHLGEAWRDVVPESRAIKVLTSKDTYEFDAVIMGTGFSVDLALRPELALIRDKVLLWRDRVSTLQAARHHPMANFPYLGPGFEFLERAPGVAPGIGNIHCFNWGVTMSHGALAGDIPGLAEGVNRLARAIVRDLFLSDADRLLPSLHAYDDRELEPTRFFIPRL